MTIFWFLSINGDEGFEPTEAKQVYVQQKVNEACVDGCEEYEHPALSRTRRF